MAQRAAAAFPVPLANASARLLALADEVIE
jgi:hypothetical protein